MTNLPKYVYPELLTPKEVMGLLHISQATFYRILEGGLIPFYKVGRSLRVDRNDLMIYLSQIRIKSVSE